MAFTEKDLEIKIREMIQSKIIINYNNIQMLKSKDVTDIICCRNGEDPCLFFIELKHYASSNNRIGFGAKGKCSFQPEILKTKPSYFEKNTRWIFCDENSNYYILSNEDCRKYIMGNEISYEKQNNFKLTIFSKEKKYNEDEVCNYLKKWFLS